MSRRISRWFLFVAVVPVFAGCVDETIVYRDRELFEDPSAAAGGFLGYSDASAKLTVCGNCHVGQQKGWKTTGHADAWVGLQASGHARESCEGCHTVSELGNLVTAEAGWSAVPEPRYHDVQCESCHGPGLDHVTNPDATQPLAPMTVGLDQTTGCGECHSGAHHPFVDQWAQSAHGLLPNGGYAGTRDGCNQCHNGKVALATKFKETDDYIEKDQLDVMPITCGVCHDPHGSDFEANLRAPITEASTENLCVTCHSRSAAPTNWSSHGPHSPQGLLVLGTNAGWIPPGFSYDSIRLVSSHGTEANPKLCATCHVNRFTTTDAEGVEVTSVGHLFEAIPCVDPVTGQPNPSGDCPVGERNFSGCTASGCHTSETTARAAFLTTRDRLNRLLDQLWKDSDGDAEMETTDGGLLPRVLAERGFSELDPGSPTVTVAKGAMWNALLAFTHEREVWESFSINGVHQSAHKGSGEGVHNPFLLESLLLASIDAVEDRYGFQPSPSLVRTPQLRPPPGAR